VKIITLWLLINLRELLDNIPFTAVNQFDNRP
jgi:hypothetical protein